MRQFTMGTFKVFLHTYVCMSDTEYRNIRLTKDAYDRLKRHKQEGESFSDTVERLAGERSLLELAGVLTDDEAERMRDAIRDQEDRSRKRLDRLADRMDS
jgi:predicted CopG family antitoxin